MFKLVNENGEAVAYAAEVTYIRIGQYGTYVDCGEGSAVGVAANGEPYNLLGHDEIAGAEAVTVEPVGAEEFTEAMAEYEAKRQAEIEAREQEGKETEGDGENEV